MTQKTLSRHANEDLGFLWFTTEYYSYYFFIRSSINLMTELISAGVHGFFLSVYLKYLIFLSLPININTDLSLQSPNPQALGSVRSTSVRITALYCLILSLTLLRIKKFGIGESFKLATPNPLYTVLSYFFALIASDCGSPKS